MKFQEFKQKVLGFAIISTSHLNSLGENPQMLRNQLTQWQERGLVIRLRKGLYLLAEHDRRFTPSRIFLANQLYQPSYVSSEYAMGFYDLIPERVADVTSVSPKKTTSFENQFGRFIFQHVKQTCFQGYTILQDENNWTVFIAEPEKALMDYFYLNSSLFGNKIEEVFDSLRLQNLRLLRAKKIKEYASIFCSKKLMSVADACIEYIRKAGK